MLSAAQEWSGPGFKDRVTAATAFVLHLMDGDEDGLVSPEEIRNFAKKFVTFVFVMFNTVLNAGMVAVAATVPPLLAVALLVKAELVGGSPDAISKEEAMAILRGEVCDVPPCFDVADSA